MEMYLHLLSRHFCVCTLTVCVFFAIPLYSTHTAILPSHLTIWRWHKNYNPFMDIRRNLFLRYETTVIPTSEFFYYKVKSTTYPSKCRHFQLPELGDIICVECQNIPNVKTVCKNHDSLFSKSYFYHAINSYCHGEWIMITEVTKGSCPTFPSFVVIKRDE